MGKYIDILSAVDGTGPYSNKKYATHFKTSFIKTMDSKWGNSFHSYRMGPAMDGISTGVRSNLQAASAIRDYWTVKLFTDFEPRIFLAGYSRGGAAAIAAARTLHRMSIPVYALLLFDAVDRSITVAGEIIPPNVKHCRHLIRNSETESRPAFGNVGLSAAHGVDFPTPKKFCCTHGAMGGVPWDREGPDGFIHEWEGDFPQKQVLNRGGKPSKKPSFLDSVGAAGLGEPVLKGFDEAGYAATKTNVTLQKEQSNGLRVFSEMFGMLAQLRGRTGSVGGGGGGSW